MNHTDRPRPILSPPEIDRLMAVATPKERDVIAARYGLDRGQYRDVPEAAEDLGFSVEEVRAAEHEAVTRFNEIERAEATPPTKRRRRR